MTAILEAPPEPSHDELEALIEEARRRARRRRLLIGGAASAALLLIGLAVGLALVLRGGTSTAVPRGFHLVQARGPVTHLRFENLLDRGVAIDVSSGAARPARITQELWWNEGSGLTRTVYRRDGRIVADWVVQQCQGSGPTRFCAPPWPYLPYQQLPSDAQRPKSEFRRVGSGTFRGHHVVWSEQLYRPPGSKPSLGGDQVAYDAVTHRPVALRTINRSGRFKGRTFSYNALKVLPDLPGKKVAFVVPDGGADRNPPSSLNVVTGHGLRAARKALGKTPLWLGRAFQGRRLRSVVVGREGEATQRMPGLMLLPAHFARFDYGRFSVKEFGQDRPPWYLEDPAAGTVLVADSRITFARDGILVSVEPAGPKFRLDRATALALAEALRPVDG
jgi:hypothetical protein